ncbi:MAG: hypothetical protein R2713_06265 [Ilumatobacteraceae bacterium]
MAPLDDVEFLGRRRWESMPAASNTRAGWATTPARTGGASAALAERSTHEMEQRCRVGRGRGVDRRVISASADSTFGRGTNTLAGISPAMRAVDQCAIFTVTAP